MAYDGTIPALSNLISNDIPAMKENFSLLESAQVVDEGSTADGDYIRYENGWQICMRDDIIATHNASRRLIANWSFPVSFIDENISFSFITEEESADSKMNPSISEIKSPLWRSVSSTGLQISVFRIDGKTGFLTGDEILIRGIAIGRWKE